MQKKPRKKTSAMGTPAKVPVNKIADRQIADALERAKLEAMKELAYGASHEINNPLANISTRAQTLLKLETDPEKRRMLAAIHSQAMRAHEMIADLMLFARPPELKRSRFNLVELLRRVIAEMHPQAAEQRTALNLKPSPESIEIEADATQLAVAIRALIQNSLEALGSEGTVQLQASVNNTEILITVTDNGPGIPPEIRPHIFEPFYSGREAGRGLGFGLSKCWRIITDHAGTIQIDDVMKKGAVFRIILPSLASGQKAH
jgi:signal transduction histidine kinase